ncbi:PP2C family protein-serine/threonine phosphatase [Georgenia sp. SUBG003]|uniref:PP2C family protein-serine/threonine phosphatase n=1 Tax=Georgenia sp. SUBG003 TaxID=1497974 RepID=UPI000A75B479
MSPVSVQLRFAARSDVGLVRASNQDSGYAGPHLLVLADGMGGPAGGDIASSVAVAHLAELDDAHSADDLLDLLRSAVGAAHDELIQRSEADPDLAGLGTTCIAVLRAGNKLAMVHIGDSRAYLLRGGELTQVTTDHTFVQYLVSTGRLTPEQAERHPQRNVILRALGDNDSEVQLDESLREALPGDRWLLASDGLFGVVSHETIAETLLTVTDPGECADDLIHLALRAGGPDNVTCVVADVVTDGSPDNSPQVVGAAAKDRLRATRGGRRGRGQGGRPDERRPAAVARHPRGRRRSRPLPRAAVGGARRRDDPRAGHARRAGLRGLLVDPDPVLRLPRTATTSPSTAASRRRWVPSGWRACTSAPTCASTRSRPSRRTA